ncbi:CD1871A family CXXC motif-containing protein [Lutispora thermophila]|uniref:Thioredoxin n=1 Tax=Lutispora thermophila DSM 19022 TaxID=1122184 RepID=A0A1M6FX39_9FIRM|nr:CD1871A family CXXC motif-containing protein [Lutispora thermophila]SHJ02246.1 hypothetical protein SAMN02745176_02147 [Lutispora thermophila DSM 19022]
MNEKVKYLLLLMSFALIAMGVYRGEVAEVLQKAINICLECMGIG